MEKISFGFENPLKSRFGEEFFKNLPKDPGVYTFLDSKGFPLYIGKADNLKRRLMSYGSAKPGQAAEHILEMIEHAEDLRWEIHGDGELAMKRETELIRSVRPRYNIALNWDVNYLYLGMRIAERIKGSETVDVEFRLSHLPIGEGFTSYGCFRHRGKTKLGFTALLRLLFAAYCPRERFQIPAKICRSSPPYRYRTRLPEEVVEPLESLLSGDDFSILRILLDRLLEREALPKQLYIPLQRDIGTVKEFFQYGPKDTRELACRLKKRPGSLVSQDEMDRLISREFKSSLKA